jgi:hypothetical protein
MSPSFQPRNSGVSNPKKRPTISDLYPEMSSEEQAEAEYNLKQYVALVWRICQRIKHEKRKI